MRLPELTKKATSAPHTKAFSALPGRSPTCAHRHLPKWLVGLALAISALTAVLMALTIAPVARWRPSIVHKSSNLVCRFDQLLLNPRMAQSDSGPVLLYERLNDLQEVAQPVHRCR
jgi:hypothetical protein